MKKLLISVAAAALFASNAQAADVFTSTQSYADEARLVENVRTVCDEFGRCWREPSRRTVIIERDSYNYAPRERYIEPGERYIERRYYDDRPAAGVGIRDPGVGVGVGGDRW